MEFRLARSAFFRLLGVVYALAFASAATQVLGLLGSRGISPARELLNAARVLGPDRFRLFPTVFWLDASDRTLLAVAWGGAGLALFLVAGFAPRVLLFLLWALYLSIVTVGGEFFLFQWDGLLLEAGLLAIFFAPRGVFARLEASAPPRLAPLLLLQFLALRLHFASGIAKLTSGDETWRGLRALEFHYETQPLPTPLGWWAHQLPGWFQTVSTAAALGLEIGAPLLALFGRRGRLAAFVLLAFLQLLIAASGNYGFFNLLSVALLVVLLDDRAPLWPRRWREAARAAAPPAEPARIVRMIAPPAFSALGLFAALQLFSAFAAPIDWPSPVAAVLRAIAPFRSVNAYGLFRVMTTERPEIVLFASRDGETFREVPFCWKPGDPARRPPFCAPHMPRLDWQLWFAALSRARKERWFDRFLARLLEGSPDVLALLPREAFPEGPPREVYAVLYRYRFTDITTRRETGDWWRREEQRLYRPIMRRSG
jgi:uncharacterized membrane protein YphA (DoxX/SURF4 family)